MYCIHCGTKLSDDSNFCTACGKPVESAKHGEQTIRQAHEPTQREESPSVNTVGKKGEVIDLSKEEIKQILAALRDNDIMASDQAGEIRCQADRAQSIFMKLLKKGLLCLVVFLIPLAHNLQATSKSVTMQFPIGTAEFTFSCNGKSFTFKEPEKLDMGSDKKSYYVASNVNLQPGDKITIDGKLKKRDASSCFCEVKIGDVIQRKDLNRQTEEPFHVEYIIPQNGMQNQLNCRCYVRFMNYGSQDVTFNLFKDNSSAKSNTNSQDKEDGIILEPTFYINGQKIIFPDAGPKTNCKDAVYELFNIKPEPGDVIRAEGRFRRNNNKAYKCELSILGETTYGTQERKLASSSGYIGIYNEGGYFQEKLVGNNSDDITLSAEYVIPNDFSYEAEIGDDYENGLAKLRQVFWKVKCEALYSSMNDGPKKREQIDNIVNDIYSYSLHVGYPDKTQKSSSEEEPQQPYQPTIDTTAPEESGESGWKVPAIIGLIVGGGFVWLRRRKKTSNGDSHKEGKKEEKNEDDEDENVTYTMYIRKNFGDKIVPGAKPQRVYARIAKSSPKGGETTDKALTAMINIIGDDYLIVNDQKMEGEYISAAVEAPQKENNPDEAVVHFRLSGGGASFTNRMHFKIGKPQVIFLQDELTIPACYDKPIFLPFELDGTEENADVELKMGDETYEVTLDQDKESRIYYAVISEKTKKAEMPGEKTLHYLYVTATDKSGNIAKAKFQINRFGMGLVCRQLDHIDCFLEEYDVQKHLFNDMKRSCSIDRATTIGEPPIWQKVDFTPAETKFWLTLYEYDEKENRIIAIPPKITSFEIKAENVPDEYVPTPKQAAGMFHMGGTMMSTIPGMGSIGSLMSNTSNAILHYRSPIELSQLSINELGIHLDAKKGMKLENKDGHSLQCIFVCTRGILQKPNRIKAIVSIEAEHEGRKYTMEQKVMLRSQPRRVDLTYEEKKRLYARDHELIDILEQKATDIFIHHYANLEVLHTYIENMLKYYDEAYGVDFQQARTVFRIYNRYLNNEMEKAQSENELNCLSDTVDGMLKTGKWAEDKMGFWGRIAAGVVSMGISEGVFNSLEVMENMKDYVDKDGDNIFVGFCLGAEVPLREYLLGKMVDPGLKKAKEYFAARKAGKAIVEKSYAMKESLKKAQETAKKIAKESAENTTNKVTKEGVEQATSKVCHIGNQAERINAVNKTTKEIAKEGEQKAIASAKNMNGKDLGSSFNNTINFDEMVKLEKEAIADAKSSIDEFAQLIKQSNGQHNKDLMLKVIELQQNKNVLEVMQFSTDESMIEIRKVFNKELKMLNDRVDMEVRRRLCELHPELKMNMQNVKTLNASATKDIEKELGKKITFDRDSTYYFIRDGKEIYFDQKEIEMIYSQTMYEIAENDGGQLSSYMKFMKECDHTIIQSDIHPESYGTENYKIMSDATRAAEALPDVGKVAEATKYKCMEWYSEGLKLLASSNREYQKVGISKIREGFRQCYKQFNNYIINRNSARMVANGKSFISDELFEIMSILRQTDVKTGGISVAEAIFALRQKGISPEGLFDYLRVITLEIG